MVITKEQTHWWVDVLTERAPTDLRLSLPLRIQYARYELLDLTRLEAFGRERYQNAIAAGQEDAGKFLRRAEEVAQEIAALRAFLTRRQTMSPQGA